MQASVVSSFSVSAIATEPSHQYQRFEPEIENIESTDSEFVETLHKMPVDQLYLKELEFRLAMSKYACHEEIPLAESNHLVMQPVTQSSQLPLVNAFACSTLLYPVVIYDRSWSANKFDSNSDRDQVQRKDRQPEYCQKLRQLFREAESNKNTTDKKPMSAFQRLVRAVDWNNAEKTEVMTFKQWFLSGPIFVPGMHVIVPKNP